MENNKTTALSLAVESSMVSIFFHILQEGFIFKAQVGCSIKEFLGEQCGLSNEYIEKRISTVFLDRKPVDDVESAIIRDGSTLSLSGAMPGLVGAVMRTGSYYASFRNSITHRESGKNFKQEDGMINLKLFNIVMSELGADFLKRGIYIKPYDLKDFLSKQTDDFWRGCREILLNQRSVKPEQLRDWQFLSESDLVFFSVKTSS